MIIYYFNLLRALFTPDEAYSVLIVNSNTVLSFSVSAKDFETITWRYLQIR